MAQQIISTGTLADGSDGDTTHIAFNKVIANFAELYTASSNSVTAANALTTRVSTVENLVNDTTKGNNYLASLVNDATKGNTALNAKVNDGTIGNSALSTSVNLKLNSANPVFTGTLGINRTGVFSQDNFRVTNTGTDVGIGGSFATWNTTRTPGIQVDAMNSNNAYLALRVSHWGVRHLFGIDVLEGGSSSSTSTASFHFSTGTGRHTFFDNGNATFLGTLTQNSDYRIKTNIDYMVPENIAAKLRLLKPMEYNDTRRSETNPKLVGLIAGELQKQFPLLVEGAVDAVSHEEVYVGDLTPYNPGEEPDGYIPPHIEIHEVPILQNANYIGLVNYLLAGWQHSDIELNKAIARIEALEVKLNV